MEDTYFIPETMMVWTALQVYPHLIITPYNFSRVSGVPVKIKRVCPTLNFVLSLYQFLDVVLTLTTMMTMTVSITISLLTNPNPTLLLSSCNAVAAVAVAAAAAVTAVAAAAASVGDA